MCIVNFEQLLIAKYHYDKAYFYVKVELLNTFKYYIEQFIKFTPKERIKNIKLIEKELNDPIYMDLNDLYGTTYHDIEFVKLIEKKDAEGIYNKCEFDYNHRPFKLKVRAFVRFIIGKFL